MSKHEHLPDLIEKPNAHYVSNQLESLGFSSDEIEGIVAKGEEAEALMGNITPEIFQELSKSAVAAA